MKQKAYSYSKSGILIMVLVTLGFLALLLRVDILQQSIDILEDASIWFVLMGILFAVVTYVMATISYASLSLKPVRIRKLFLVQVASSFASKLVPAGIGSLATNTRFLFKHKHTLPQAATVAFTNNFMGFMAHLSIFIVVLSLYGTDVYPDRLQINSAYLLFAGIGIFLILIMSWAIAPYIRKTYRTVLGSIKRSLLTYAKHPKKLIKSYLASLAISASYLGILYLSIVAINVSLSMSDILVVFSIGVLAGSITPTPGGVGGAEAGIVAMLVAYGMNVPDAVSVALLYRFITYWLPIIPGFIAFQYILNRKYI